VREGKTGYKKEREKTKNKNTDREIRRVTVAVRQEDGIVSYSHLATASQPSSLLLHIEALCNHRLVRRSQPLQLASFVLVFY